MRNTRRIVILLLIIIIAALPCCGLADGAYEELKTLMSLKIVSDVTPPDYLDASSSVAEAEKTTVCVISLNNGYIGISGRNLNNKYESRFYNNLSINQLLLYAISVCTMYESIDQAKTTADDFWILVAYGDGEDESILITDAEQAKQVSELLSEIARN